MKCFAAYVVSDNRYLKQGVVISEKGSNKVPVFYISLWIFQSGGTSLWVNE